MNNKRAIAVIAIVGFLALAMLPALATHVDPDFVTGNSNCDSIGSDATESLTIVDPVLAQTYTGSDGTEITLTNVTRRQFDFSTDGALVFDLIVKGSAANHYDYDADADGAVRSDTGLMIPNGNKLNVVHFCYGGNTPPVAVNDSLSGAEDTTINGNVLTNDTDADLDGLTAIKLSDPANGEVTLGEDGAVSYTPDPNFNGSDSFTYRANDGFANSGVATVNITVTAVNDAPVAANDAGQTVVDQAVEINVLNNDTDIDSSGLTVTNLQTTTDEGGTAAVTSGGVTYTPATGFTGTDTFTYTANDGPADSNVATVTVTVFAGELVCDDDTGLVTDDSGMSAIFFRLADRGPCETAKLWTVNFDPDDGTIEFLIDPLFTEEAEYTAQLTFEPFTPDNPNTQSFDWDLDDPGGDLTPADWCDSATFVAGQLTTAVPPEGEDGCVASQTTQTVGEEGQAQTTWWVYFKFDLKTRG